MSTKDKIKALSREGSIYKLHTVSKLSLIIALGLVFFLHDPRKITIFAILILALCFWSYTDFIRHPLKILFILLVVAGSFLYDWRTSQPFEKIFIGGARLALVMTLGFLAESMFSDRELRILVGRRLSPLLIGSLVGIQRMGEINKNILHAQKVRGIHLCWSLRKLYMWFSSWGYAFFVNIARLTETVHYQFILRGYGQFKPSLLLRKKWNLVDYLAIIITFLVIIIAIIPWSRISGIFNVQGG